MSPLDKKKSIKIIGIFSVVWVIVCALFSLCGPECYLPCLGCAAVVVGFAWLCIPLWEHDYKQYLKQLEEQRKSEERAKLAKNKPKTPIWPIIKKILGFVASAIIVITIIGCITSGISSFIANYGMVAFLLLLILLVLVFG